MRMRNSFVSIIVAAVLALAAHPQAMAQQADTPAMAPQADAPADAPKLAESAPDRYVVVPGDTLWGIAARFLRDPYRWPDVWEPNKDRVKNPHWIYPGDVLVLDRSGRNPRIRLATVKVEPRVRVDELNAAIATIPPGVIEPYLSQPLVVEEGGLASAPKIVAAQEGHVYLGRGDLAYVTGELDPNVGTWQVYRPGAALIDPDTKENLGYEAIYLGLATVERNTKPVTMRITDSKLEMGAGDRLVPAVKPELVDYIPRSPKTLISGKVISIYGATPVSGAGSTQIVGISRGRRDGLQRGDVLALWNYGQLVTDRSDILASTQPPPVQLPDERNGLVFIFRVFDKVSYGLIMSAAQAVRVGDIAKTP
jgi:hypothetical protein